MEAVDLASNSDKIHVSTPPLANPISTGSRIVLEATHGWRSLHLQRIWHYRELLYFLVWRDIKVRYKQTIIGLFWVILQPLTSMLIFSVIFGWLLQVPSNGAPYPIFVFAGLLPWQYFAASLTRASNGLVDNAGLVTKIYFPRLILPLTGVISGLIDLAAGFVVLLGLMLFYQIALTPAVILLPVLVLLAMLTALGFSLWLSALNVRYRDIRQLIPFIIQVWMYATPVIYSSQIVPERLRFLLSLNPMAVVVEGFRWVLLGQQMTEIQPVNWMFVIISISVTTIVLLGGVIYFRHTERTFADII